MRRRGLTLSKAQLARLRGDDPVTVARGRRPDPEDVPGERRDRAARPAVGERDATGLRKAVDLHALPDRPGAVGEHVPPGAPYQVQGTGGIADRHAGEQLDPGDV